MDSNIARVFPRKWNVIVIFAGLNFNFNSSFSKLLTFWKFFLSFLPWCRYFLERSHSARLTLAKACDLCPEEVKFAAPIVLKNRLQHSLFNIAWCCDCRRVLRHFTSPAWEVVGPIYFTRKYRIVDLWSASHVPSKSPFRISTVVSSIDSKVLTFQRFVIALYRRLHKANVRLKGWRTICFNAWPPPPTPRKRHLIVKPCLAKYEFCNLKSSVSFHLPLAFEHN